MVNALQKLKAVVVKAEAGDPAMPRVTSNGGLALAQALARRMGLWERVERAVAGRRDPGQGFTVSAVVGALVHGLLAGGRGLSATEPMRGDGPLLAMLGLERAPSAETVEEVVKYVARAQGARGLNDVLGAQASWLVERSARGALAACAGFVPFWVDGSLLEVGGRKFDSIKVVAGERGQVCVGAFCGPYAVGMDFAVGGEGELTVGRRLLDQGVARVLRPRRLMKQVLIVLDSLYGNGPTLEQLEGYREKPAYVVGVGGLSEAQRVMGELPEWYWRDTGEDRGRGWAASGLSEAWLRCGDWGRQRTMVCRRWRKAGEMIWNYAAVVTNLEREDARVARATQEAGGFAQGVWGLYSHKQAMENQWKDLLRDLSLHHPPCAGARVNAVFYAMASLAYNLSVGVRRLGLGGGAWSGMTLWRLRRDFFQLGAYARRHGRVVVMRFLDAREYLTRLLLAAMGRLARL
jgi:hypothetical protein